jgi:hypothetical protein
MYRLKKLTSLNKSENHLEDNISNLSSKEEKSIDFEKPWLSSFIHLSEAQWKELNENGRLKYTFTETTTVEIVKENE